MIKDLLTWLLKWSEVWALLIPLLVLLIHPKQPAQLKPVIIYLWMALVINIAADLIASFKIHFPDWAQSNNPLYNIHSIVRLTCFSCFFIALQQPSFTQIKKLLPFIASGFIIINFTFFDDFFYAGNLSGNLLTVEAYLLLVYCMVYYLSGLNEEEKVLTSGFDFWVVTGLGIYVVINFFIFLFYVPMITQNAQLAVAMWRVHNIAYIILCIFLAKAFYAVTTA
ncbi:MAG TPA: hypothetical protein VEY06_01210 [Flavisolibacter sp.]|jgi:hypothetical protein|nr:hypothetical protein [Flavisolibacter sp.]